ncbi:MAG: adenylate/guanylate cyclase domain-containing protein [Desulfobaccales bacterium]
MANILIVDDKDYNLKAYKLALDDAGLGANIITAKDENEAQKILAEKIPIDVIITDLCMLEEQGGIDVLRYAKENDPLIMVIIITAFEKILDRYKAYDLGAFDCLTKGAAGIKTEQEIVVKTKAALRFRELALSQIEYQNKMSFLKRYFDPRVFDIIDQNPDLLNIKSKTLTIGFWDIRGFSKLCEVLKAHPKLIAGFLKEFFKGASEIIFNNNGVLDKFIGDAVMAIWGALNGSADEGRDEAANAINAAVELRGHFNRVKENWMEQWKLYTPHTIEIDLGCGIHTGETLIGNVGTDIRDQFTVLGPHVNFAQRIESRANKGKILISASTKVRIESKYEVNLIETIDDVKNIPGTFEIYEVIKRKE